MVDPVEDDVDFLQNQKKAAGLVIDIIRHITKHAPSIHLSWG
jgi:hypothetical protein